MYAEAVHSGSDDPDASESVAGLLVSRSGLGVIRDLESGMVRDGAGRVRDLGANASDATPARAPAGTGSHGRIDSRAKVLAIAVLVWALLYTLTYLPARGNGSDFQVFYAGAVADARGIDPFDWPALWRIESALYNTHAGHGQVFAFAPYGDPPPFALLMRPLTAFGESTAYWPWTLLLLLCGAAGTYLGLVGWPRRSRLFCTLLVAISPAALFDIRLGQNSTPLLLALGLAIRLSAARRFTLAGMALGIGLFKPHLMVPVALVFVLAAPRDGRLAVARGFLVASVLAVGIGLIFDGGPAAYAHWLGSVEGFRSSLRHQPDIASLAGLYLGNASARLSLILTAGSLCLAALVILRLTLSAWTGYETSELDKQAADQGRLTLGTWADDEGARTRLLWGGIAAYMTLSPYIHTSDQVLLALPLLWLIGADGKGLRDSAVLLAAAVAVLAPMVVLRDYHTVGINALPPLCIGLAYWLCVPRQSRLARAADHTRPAYSGG